MPITLDGTLGITTPALTVSGATVNTGGISTAGNLTFTSTGQRIIGDFSNSTLANRLMFQTSTTNSNSILSVIPSGTATTTAFQAFNNSDPTNASQADLRVSGLTDVRLSSTSAGSGTYLPLTFYTNGSERMRIDTSGRLLLGATGAPASSAVRQVISGGTSNYLEFISTANDGVVIGNNAGNMQFFTFTGALGSETYTERMRIDTAGNVGIGVSSVASPSSSRRALQVSNSTSGGVIYLSNDGTESNNPRIFGSVSTQYDLGFASGGSTGFINWYTNGTERMRIDSSGNVGIGTSSPAQKLHVNTSSNVTFLGQSSSGSNTAYVYLQNATSSSTYTVGYGSTGDNAIIGAGGAERMRIDSSGNVGIGTTNTGSFRLNVADGSSATRMWIYNTANAAAGVGIYMQVYNGATTVTDNTIASDNTGNMKFFTGTTAGSERMRITSVGNVGIGTSAPSAKLHVYTTTTEGMYVESGTTGNGGKIILKTTDNADTAKYIMVNAYWTEIGVNSNEGFRVRNTANNIIFSVSGAAGNCVISGSLSKGSGSFRIDHPLPELEETHQLVHSFIEGPQADLIYRGVVTLVNGKAEVNIDEAAGMTYGTFEVLCRDVQCFTTNESDWVAVRGKVSGNILTIEAQDSTATSTISWMVIGERKDKHMMETEWTDSNGKVIVEPLKPVN